MLRVSCGVVWLSVLALPAVAAEEPEGYSFPAAVCTPEQTGGFHDYPEGEEAYEPALFHPRQFELNENLVFMMNLTEAGGPDLYLTMSIPGEEGARTTELECRRVRGISGAMGFSCVNLPPSEMLLINAESLRFTRTSVGGWTFAGAMGDLAGDSIFVEYGQCRPLEASDQPTPAGATEAPADVEPGAD